MSAVRRSLVLFGVLVSVGVPVLAWAASGLADTVVRPFAGDWSATINGTGGGTLHLQAGGSGMQCPSGAVDYSGTYNTPQTMGAPDVGTLSGCTDGTGRHLNASYKSGSGPQNGTISIDAASGDTSFSGNFNENSGGGSSGTYNGTLSGDFSGSGRTQPTPPNPPPGNPPPGNPPPGNPPPGNPPPGNPPPGNPPPGNPPPGSTQPGSTPAPPPPPPPGGDCIVRSASVQRPGSIAQAPQQSPACPMPLPAKNCLTQEFGTQTTPRLSKAAKDGLTGFDKTANAVGNAAGVVGLGLLLTPSPDPVTKGSAGAWGFAAGVLKLVGSTVGWLGWCFDPPDANYQQVQAPRESAGPHVDLGRGTPIAVTRAVRAMTASSLKLKNLAFALLTATNRAHSAALAHDGAALHRQLMAAAHYARAMATLIAQDRTVRGRLGHALVAAHRAFSLSAADIRRVQSKLARNGLPSRSVSTLRALGQPTTWIRQFGQFLSQEPVDTGINSARLLTDRTLAAEEQQIANALRALAGSLAAGQVT